MIRFLVFIFCFISSLSFASQDAEIQALSFSKEWLRLGYYHKNLFGNYKSKVIESNFFLHPEGRTRPDLELIANIEAFKNPASKANCRFPARYLFLKSKVKGLAQQTECPDFEDWKSKLEVSQASLIYSSAYPNNPASMFGHTFLKLKSSVNAFRSEEENPDLLNYGVNFSAATDNKSMMVVEVLSGLLGFYEGYFSLTPYFRKVNEYSNQESRDLWEYFLNLNQSEIDLLVAHLWELRMNSGFKYYFIDENCSYYILALLEAIKPEWNLTESFLSYVMPVDTLRVLVDTPGAVKEVKLRPSVRKRLYAKQSLLTSDQKKSLKSLMKGSQKPKEVSDPEVLNVYLDWITFKNFREAADSTTENAHLRREALIARSKLGLINPKELKFEEERPDHAHRSSSVGLSAIDRASEYGLGLRLRWGFHDFLDSSQGFNAGSSLDFLDFQFRYFTEKSRFQFEELKLFEITSLFPIDALDQRVSWGIRPRFKHLNYLDKENNLGAGVELEGGVASQLVSSKLLGYLLLSGEVQASPALEPYLGFLGGVHLGINGRVARNTQILIEPKVQRNFLGVYEKPWFESLLLGASYSPSERFQVRLTFTETGKTKRSVAPYQEAALGAQWYW